MKIFKGNGEYIVDTDKLEELKHGTYGKIYPYEDNKCLKVFNNVGYHQSSPILTIKELSLPNFYKISDLLYNDDFKYVGYISDYYTPDDYNILENKEYLVNAINNMLEGIIKLTERGFLVTDLHIGNVIVNKDDITIIDVDDYRKTNNDNMETNIYRYKEMIKSLLYRYLTKYDVKDIMTAYQKLMDLVDVNSLDVKHFNNVMRRYKKPIDYFHKTLK